MVKKIYSVELWEKVSDEENDGAKIQQGSNKKHTVNTLQLGIEGGCKESVLRKQQLWNEAVLKGRR